MKSFNGGLMANMDKMNMYHNNMYPMMTMPEQQLESMYPKVYFIILPVVNRQCDIIDTMYSYNYTPTREEFDSMVEDMYVKVEPDVKAELGESGGNPHGQSGNPNGYGGGLLRALVGTLFLRELIRRRRRPIYGYPYGGYGPGFGAGYGPGFGSGFGPGFGPFY